MSGQNIFPKSVQNEPTVGMKEKGEWMGEPIVSVVCPDGIRKRDTFCNITFKNYTFIAHIVYHESMVNILQFLRWKAQSEFSRIVM